MVTTLWYDLLCTTPLQPHQFDRNLALIIKLYGTSHFNAVCYTSYYGTYAHYIPHFIQMNTNITREQLGIHVHLLFNLANYNLINLSILDYYGQTPEDCLNFYKDLDCLRYWRRTLQLIFTKRLVIIQQSYIRRWLACRLVIRKKMKKILLEILLSPPMQIQNFSFTTFNGGVEYYHCFNRFHEN